MFHAVLQDYFGSGFSIQAGTMFSDSERDASSLQSQGVVLFSVPDGEEATLRAAVVKALGSVQTQGLAADHGILASVVESGLVAAAESSSTKVESVGDFPEPVGGVSTLESGIWLVSGAVAMGATTLRVEAGAYLVGTIASRDSLTWSGASGPGVTFVGGTHTIREITLVSDMVNDTMLTDSVSSLFARNISVIGRVGNLSTSALTFITDSSFVALTEGFSFSGAMRSVIMRSSNLTGVAGASPLVDLDSATLDLFSVLDIQFSPSAAQVAISGLAANGNVNSGGEAEVELCRFNGSGGALAQITTNDVRWVFSGCAGIINSTTVAEVQFSGNALETVAGGSFVKVNAIYGSGIVRRFSVDSGGDVTYLDPNPKTLELSAVLVAKMASGGSKSISFQVFKTPIATGIPVAVGIPFTVAVINSSEEYSVLTLVEVAQNDVLEIRLQNNDDAIGVIVSDAEIIIKSVPAGV